MFKSKSKKGSKEALNDLNLDTDLDFDFNEFDLDTASSPKKDRHPAIAVPSQVLKGMGEELKSPAFFRKLLKTALPREYGQALDFADSSVSELRNIYKTSLNDARPAINQLKRNTERILPSVKSSLPKKLADKIDRWSKSASSGSSGFDPEAQRESELANMLSDVFKTQTEVSQQQQKVSDAKSVIKDTIDQTRHNDNMGQLDAIRANTQRLSDYQDKIGSSFQRKSLELQYRHFFVAKDMLEQSKELGIVIKENLEAITKNTALPEVQKIHNSERFKEHVRNRFIGGTLNHLSKTKDAMFAKFKQNLTDKLKSNVKDFMDNFESLNMMAESIADQSAMANDVGVSSRDMYANMAGSMITSSLGTRMAKKLRTKMKDNDKVNKLASTIAYWLSNKEEGLNKVLDSDTFQKLPGGESISDFLKQLMVGNRGVEFKADTDNSSSLQDAAIWNRQANKSLTEIIPGYLSMILREVQIFRTGNESIGLTRYDYNRNAFASKKSVAQGMMNKIADKNAVNDNKKTSSRLVSQLDPHNRLSKAERRALQEQFNRDRVNGVQGTSKHYSDVSSYRGPAMQYAEKFADMFKKHFELDNDLNMADTQSARDKRLEFSRGYETIIENYIDRSEEIQEMVNLGQYDELRELGVLNAKGQLDRDKLIDYFSGKATYGGKQKKSKSSAESPLRNLNPIQLNRNRGGNGNNQTRVNQNRPNPNLGQSSTNPAPVIIPILPAPSMNLNELMNLGQRVGNRVRSSLSAGGNLASHRINEITQIIRNRAGTLGMPGTVGGDTNTIDITPEYTTETAAQPSTPREHQKSELDVLIEIRDILNEFKTKGISVGGMLGNMPNLQGMLGQGGSLLGRLGMHAGNLITSGAKSLVKGLPNAARQIAASTRAITKAGMGIGGWALGGAKDWLMQKKEVVDVFIKGEAKPRIEAWKLEAGLYYDKVTGKVITKLSDIKNTIVDKDGNIVLDISEFKNIYTDSKTRAVRILTKLKDMGVNAIKNTAAMTNNFYSFAFNKGKTLFQFARSKLAGDDVYVVGRTEPALTALLMRNGNYKSKNKGKTIWKGFQIDGPVVDLDGNVVLSMDDLRLGIVDKNGKPFVGPIKRALQFGMNALNKAKDMAVTGINKVMSVGKSIASSVGSFLTGRRGSLISIRMFNNTDNAVIAKILTDIKNILLDRMPPSKRKKKLANDIDDDGLRDNSWQERAKEAKDRLKYGLGKGKDMALGGLSGLTAAMSRLTKTLKDKTDDAKDEEGGWLSTISDWFGRDGKKKGRRGRTRPGRVPKSKLGKAWYYTKNFGKKTLGLGKSLLSPLAKMGGKGKAMLSALSLGALGKLFGGGSTSGAATGAGAAGAAAGAGNAASGAIGAATGAAEGTLAGAAAGAARSGMKGLASKIPYLGTVIGALELGSTWSGNGTTRDKTLDTGGILGGMGGGFAGGAALGAAAGAIFGGVGAIPGAIIGGILGTMAGSKLGRSATEMLYNNPKAAMTALGTVFPLAPGLMGLYKLFGGGGSTGPLSQLRYAQYGFTPDESSHIGVLGDLEDRLLKDVKFSNGIAEYDDNKLDLKEIFKKFGVPADNEQHVKRWCRWYKTRFKPIFLTHLSALAQVKSKASLKSVDSDLDASEKSKFIGMVAYPGGPYAFRESPFSLTDVLKVDAGYVANLVTQTKTELAKNVKTKDKTLEAKTAAVGTAITSQLAGANVPGATPATGTANLELKKDGTGNAASNAMTQVTALGAGAALMADNPKLNTLGVIRFKAYGLFNMSVNQVSALMALEKVVEDGVSPSPKEAAKWSGSMDKMFSQVGSLFGIDSLETPRGESFSMWFRARFLPVYLAAYNTVYQITSKSTFIDGLNALKPSQQLQVAQAIVGTRGSYNGNETSVWSVKDSPWYDIALNTNKASTDINVKALQDASKNDIVPEKTNKIVADPTKGTNTSANQNTTKVDNQPSFWDKTASTVSNAWNATKDYAGKAANAVTNGVSSAISSVGNMVKSGYNSAVMGATNAMEATGNAVQTGMTALGGLVSQLPNPTSFGSYEALKPLIHAAAAMVGVDPIIMAIMAAQESGFRPNAKAGSSSATGLYQFISSTWKGMLSKYGAKYGVPMDASPTDPRANAIMGALYTKDNVTTLQKRLGRAPTQTDVYLGHFLGPDTAAKFIKSDPNSIASTVLPQAAAANKNIFYEGTRPRTVGEIYQWFTNVINKKAKQFNIIPGAASVSAATPKSDKPNTKPATPAPVSPSAVNSADVAAAKANKTVPAPAPVGSTATSKIIDGAPAKSSVAKPAVVGTTTAAKPIAQDTTTASTNPMAVASAVQNRVQNNSDVLGNVSDVLEQSLKVQKESLAATKSILETLQDIRKNMNGNGFRQPQTQEPKVANSDVSNTPDTQEDNSRSSRNPNSGARNMTSTLVSMAKTMKT